MTKFQKILGQIGIVLIGQFIIGIVITILLSDWRTESEYNTFQSVSEFFINWNTFCLFLIGMLFVVLSLPKPQTKKSF